jgi:CysZ protein
MLSALARAIADAAHPKLRRVTILCLAITVLVFAALWLGSGVMLGHLAVFGSQWLDWGVSLLGGFALLILTWLLFPAVSTLVFSFFLDRIAADVEALYYPGLGPARRLPVRVTLIATARLMGLTVLLNLLALPVYLLVPLANIFVFLVLNGYLFGREYFEAVAFRRLDPILARAARRRFAGRVFLSGVFIAGLFAVPFVNLIAPVIAVAFMVHELETFRRREPPLFRPVALADSRSHSP